MGDVNTDLFLQSNHHRSGDLDTKAIPNLVRADCNHLPFRSECFETVFSNYVLEHEGVDLVQSCRELLRVSRSKVIIRVPNQFRRSKCSPAHNKVFSRKVFDTLFRRYERKIRCTGYEWAQLYSPIGLVNRIIRAKRFGKLRIPNPLHLLPCPIPTLLEIQVTTSDPSPLSVD